MLKHKTFNLRCSTIWVFCWSACYVYWYKRHILTVDLTVSGSDSDEESERRYSPEPGSSSPTKLPTPVHPQSQQRAPRYQLNLGTYTKHHLSRLWPSNAAFNSLLNSCNRFFIYLFLFFSSTDEGKYLEGEKRISFLMEKIQEIRKIYMNLKSEVACIDRRRKRAKRRDRDRDSKYLSL